jgi:subtilase family serine protease
MLRNRSLRVSAGGLLAICAVFASGFLKVDAAQAATLLTSQVPAEVANHVALRVATPDPSRELHLAIALPMRNQAELARLVHDIYDPSSPDYRHYLSVAQFTQRFGPSKSDYATALAFFARHGLAVTNVSANRFLIEGTANVATLERMLHVKFGLYQRPGDKRRFIAPDREPTPDLTVPVLSIVGLDDANPPVNRLVQQPLGLAAQAPVNGSGPNGWYLGSDMRAAYYGEAQLTGMGQSVGLMELGPYDPQAVENYFTQFGPPLTASVVPISTDGSSATCTSSSKCSDAEQALDIEYAIAMAPGLAQVQVYVGASAESVLNRMASDNTSAQLSTSWGWSHRERAVDESIFMEMAAQGQTLLTASGDDSSLRASGPWPEESAYITSVGGTDLQTTGPGGAWSSERGWAYSAGGPSLDQTISIPSYQLPFINSRNMGSTTLRNVPDIGAAASSFYICASHGCSGGNGGTSFASPIWAGFIALANQEAAIRGLPRIGFLNPLVYGMGGGKAYSRIFHDAVGGKSGDYTAVKRYDLVTGLGSPQGSTFIEALLKQVAN